MKNHLIVLFVWWVLILIIIFVPWLFVIVGSLYGMKIEIGKIEASMPGLIKSIKELGAKNENRV